MITIEVQHCIDCPTHSWCSRHNQEKYQQFYHKLEAKAKSLLNNVSIVSNIFSSYSLEKNSLATLTKDGNRYFDDHSKQTIAFPRHGAFEIRVNGILIFSKLQSNLWPNLQKVGQILLQIAEDVEAGRDIKKFSVQCTQTFSQKDEQLNETNKKIPNFKIKNRPHSSQFNATAYLPKSTLQPSLPFNQKKSNALSLNKAQAKQRKSQVDKKALMRMRERKQEQANTYYNDYHDFKDSTIQEFPTVKVAKNQISPVSKKKIQFRNEVLYPLKVPFQIAKKQAKNMPLEKKPSRKLIIKAAERKNVQFVFHQPPNRQELKKEGNQILKKQEFIVEEYQTEKTIQKVSVNQIPTDQLQQAQEQEHIYIEEDHKVGNKPKDLDQKAHSHYQQLLPPSQKHTQEDNIENIIPQSEHSLQQELRNSIKKAQSDHNQEQPVQQNVIERKDALFDELELRDTEHNQITQNEQHFDDIIEQEGQQPSQCKHEEEILEYQEIVEGNFKVKGETNSQNNHVIQQQSCYKIEEEKEIYAFISKQQINQNIIQSFAQPEGVLKENWQQVINTKENNVQDANTIQPQVLCSSSLEESIPIVLTEQKFPINIEPAKIDIIQDFQHEILRKLPSQQPSLKANELDAIEEIVQIQVILKSENLIQSDPFSSQVVKQTQKAIKHEIDEWLQQKYADCLQALKQEDQQHIHFEQIEEPLNEKDQHAMIELPERLESIAQKEPLQEEVKIAQAHEEKNSDTEQNMQSFPQESVEELPAQKDSQKNISISNIPQAGHNPDHATMKSIPNPTESSIALTNQVHSQLNCVYEDIEAKIEARLAVEQSH